MKRIVTPRPESEGGTGTLVSRYVRIFYHVNYHIIRVKLFSDIVISTIVYPSILYFLPQME